MNKKTTTFAGTLVLIAAVVIYASYGWRQAALLMVGTFAGVALYHAAFGFTSSWRNFIRGGDGSGLRAQMLMLAATTIVFLPIIAQGEVWGAAVRGNVAPLSINGVFGAFVFGVGMQLGGGCASGTLYTAGGGSTRMFVTLLGFIGGSVIGAWNRPAWDDAPSLGTFSLLDNFGLAGGLASNIALLAAVAIFSIWIERSRRNYRAAGNSDNPNSANWLTGPWPLVAGALALALVNIATLLLAGRPWGVTSAFALWGSKLLSMTAVDVAAWPYWSSPERSTSLSGPILADITSVMNIGVILGALLAAGLAGRFAPAWRVPVRSLAAALLGGILLGYGARLAYGCNIGAFFSGVASASLHGWLWFIAAFIGNIAGTRLRPLFRLA